MPVTAYNHKNVYKERDINAGEYLSNIMVDSTLKEQAEDVLSTLGLPMSGAITLFLKQIVLRKALPFDAAPHVEAPLSLDKLTGEQLYEEVKKGYDDCVAGRTAPAEEAFKLIEAELGL